MNRLGFRNYLNILNCCAQPQDDPASFVHSSVVLIVMQRETSACRKMLGVQTRSSEKLGKICCSFYAYQCIHVLHGASSLFASVGSSSSWLIGLSFLLTINESNAITLPQKCNGGRTLKPKSSVGMIVNWLNKS